MLSTEELVKTKECAANSIKFLKELEVVQKRPGMHMSNTDNGLDLHYVVYEIINNTINKALARYYDISNSLFLLRINV